MSEDFYDHQHEGLIPVEPTTEKPAYGGKELGRSSLRTSSGKQVEYVNSSLGVEGDRFTIDTVRAVQEYQKNNGLHPSGYVNEDLYNRL